MPGTHKIGMGEEGSWEGGTVVALVSALPFVSLASHANHDGGREGGRGYHGRLYSVLGFFFLPPEASIHREQSRGVAAQGKCVWLLLLLPFICPPSIRPRRTEWPIVGYVEYAV